MGAIAFWGLLVGLIFGVKESMTPNTPANIHSKKEMQNRIRNEHYK
jgi:hypothetical protein